MFWHVDYAGNLVNGKMRRSRYKYVLAGMPDIQGLINGRFHFFEVKTPYDYMRIKRNYDKYKLYKGKDKTILRYQRQILCGEQLRAFGGVGGFVSQYSHCVSFIKGDVLGSFSD